MWNIIPSLRPVVDALAPAFTAPSFATHCQLLIGWAMCLGRHTIRRVARSADPRKPPDESRRHGLDAPYNFFARSAWTPDGLACHLARLILTRVPIPGRLTLLVDDTLVHKRGEQVRGAGWFRDAVASTKKRVATARGHNWVVLAVAYTPPLCGAPVLAIPLSARLRQPGKGKPGCAALAREMLDEALGWFPGRAVTLVGDGAYACKEVLRDLPERVTFVGRMRGDAALYDPRVPKSPRGKRGRKATRGERLPSPREAAVKAGRKRKKVGPWSWSDAEAELYGSPRSLKVLTYDALWPRVAGERRLRVAVVRDRSKKLRDCYLFTTDLSIGGVAVAVAFARRWSIEVLFRSGKQVLDIGGPHQWCAGSVAKLAPWVWSVQGVVMVWYLTGGRELPEASGLRSRMGAWDSEWSLRHMLKVLREATLNETFDANSSNESELTEMVQTLKNWANLAA